jgi:hypothetical protein
VQSKENQHERYSTIKDVVPSADNEINAKQKAL